jgi:CBS domain-containing protein
MDTDTQASVPQGEYLSLYSPLSAVMRRAPVSVPPDANIGLALKTMEDKRIGSIIVAEGDGDGRKPVGIFTLQDLLRRVALKTCDLEQPISSVMTAQLVTLRPQATAYQAALAMARRGLRHLLVVDAEQRLVGIVSQNDLFALQRVGVKEISQEIREAGDLAHLQASARDIRRLIDTMIAQGVGAEPLTHFISTLNDLLTLRIIELTLAELPVPDVKWCWVALGSEGRLEQTLSTDQDNGIIFEAASGDEAKVLRERFLPFAQEVNRKLDACGFPLCKGNIMAGNPQWCLSLEEWEGQFLEWIHDAQPQALLNAAIFFDFRPLYGEDELSDALRDWLLAHTGGGALFLRHMVQNALQCAPPLGLLRDFVYHDKKDYPHTLDLKMYGARPFVDAARIFALAKGVPQTSTAQRLRAVAQRMAFDRDDVAAIIDGFYFIQLLRLRRQQKLEGPEGAANRVNPDQLNELDRHILKESFKQARKLQNRLAMDYRL